MMNPFAKFFGKKDRTKYLKALLRFLITNNIEIIACIGNKGGIGKTTIAIGMAKDKKIPHLTNDVGSAVLINKDNKYYEKTFLMDEFIDFEILKNEKRVIIDYRGESLHKLSPEELYILQRADLIIIPTGTDEALEFAGALLTARDINKLNNKVLFVTSNAPEDNIKGKIGVFLGLAKQRWATSIIKVFPLAHGDDIVSESLLRNKTYREVFDSAKPEKKNQYKEFVRNWIEMNTRIDNYFISQAKKKAVS